MVETKDQEYWETLSKKGEIESELFDKIDTLMKEYTHTDKTLIFDESLSFQDNFTNELNEKLEEIFKSSPEINDDERKIRIQNSFDHIFTYLHETHIKKIQGKISFDAYSLLNFTKALDQIISEAQFKITKQGIFIELMDPSRICLIRIILNNPTYQFIAEGSHCVNSKNNLEKIYLKTVVTPF